MMMMTTTMMTMTMTITIMNICQLGLQQVIFQWRIALNVVCASICMKRTRLKRQAFIVKCAR